MSSGMRMVSEVVGAEALRTATHACVAAARRIDTRAFDDADTARLQTQLVAPTADVLEEALRICRNALALFDDDALCTTPESELDFGDDRHAPVAPAMERSARHRIADVAFIGVTDLKPRSQRLASFADAPREEIIDECQRAIRRVIKSLSAIDVALADEGDGVSTLSFDDVLLEAIATRKHYARLRRAIVGFATPECSASARSTLERIRIHMALLVGSDAYPVLRPSDKRQLDELRTRIEDALAKREDTSAQLAESKRLFQDLVGFAGLTAEINRREELVEHDARVLEEANESLAHDVAIAPRLRARLDNLVGLDEELDRLIDRGDWSGEAWRQPIARLHDKILMPSMGRFLRARTRTAVRMFG